MAELGILIKIVKVDSATKNFLIEEIEIVNEVSFLPEIDDLEIAIASKNSGLETAKLTALTSTLFDVDFAWHESVTAEETLDAVLDSVGLGERSAVYAVPAVENQEHFLKLEQKMSLEL